MQKKSIALSLINKYRKFKNSKTPTFSIKHKFFLLFVISVTVMKKKYLKKKNQLRH